MQDVLDLSRTVGNLKKKGEKGLTSEPGNVPSKSPHPEKKIAGGGVLPQYIRFRVETIMQEVPITVPEKKEGDRIVRPSGASHGGRYPKETRQYLSGLRNKG